MANAWPMDGQLVAMSWPIHGHCMASARPSRGQSQRHSTAIEEAPEAEPTERPTTDRTDRSKRE
eukprot:5076829-Lingulodinium_polyedra.AAC.1